MKKRTKILIGISVGLFGSILLINGLYDKKEKHPRMDNIQMLEETTITNEGNVDTTTTTTTTTTKTTKKVVKTTKKITKSTTFKNVATASKQEYMNYAKLFSGYNDTQMQCLDYLWQHESNWDPNDVNKTSGACGIPQAYPCNKIQNSEGSNDWKAQIRWGIKYINNRYKNPCGAWNHFKNKHWY